jgi:hypothetical protein
MNSSPAIRLAIAQVVDDRRVHQTLRVTPAMEAGIADHIWELEELVGLLG